MEKVAASSSPLPSMSNGINKDTSNTQSTSHISSVSSSSSISNTSQAGAGEASANVPFPSTTSTVSNQLSSSPQSCQSGCQNVVKGNLQKEGDKLIDSNFSNIEVESVAVPPGESEQRKEKEASSLGDGTSNKISVIDELSSSLVPNFHVEGSGLGDSSITVAVASLTSAVPLSSSVSVPHESQGGPPGSGPTSVQSSEEMKLSLVSWYSEPDDPSRAISDSVSIPCCAQSASLHLHNGRQAVSMTNSVMSKSGSEEKENRTPEPTELPTNASNDKQAVSDNDSKCDSNNVGGHSQRVKMHVQLLEQKCSSHSENGGSKVGCSKKDSNESCASTKDFKSMKPDCPRCSRRSKSGSTTPSNNLHCHPQPRSRIPANRRVISSTKSSTELKKPIKSILKRESRGSGGSGSGSDNKSSMDSLGSSAELGNTPLRSIMTRSDSGSRAKFNLNHQIFDDSSSPSEDRFNSKLRRIEKYATLRMRKPNKVKPLEFSDTDVNSCTSGGEQSSCCSKAGTPSELMSKSMSFLEKSTVSRVERTPLSSNSSLKRQGSLRVKRSPPVWEPCTTRTTALRMQKLHESKAKSSGGHYTSPSSSNTNGHHHSGSAHSGSGESIHHLNHSTSSLHHHSTGGRNSGGGSSSGMSSKGHSHHAQVSVKDSKCGSTTKVFAKLSSAMGQTASSNQKRLKQEKYIQTEETPQHNFCSRCHHISGDGASSISPIPTVEGALDLTEQIKRLEGLANRYRNTALRYQNEYEKSEAKKTELTKQLLEAQAESSEMIDFLQAEKSTLAESLTEVENEAKKSRDEIDLIKKDSQSRCSSLVRLCEQHKQETLRYQALLARLEAQSRSTTAQMASDMSDGISSIATMKEKVCQLTNELLKAYKIPESLLSLPIDATNSIPNASVNTNLRSSLLLPLISSLAIAFPLSKLELPENASLGNTYPCQALKVSLEEVGKINQESKERPSQTTSFPGHMKESSSLQSLNQAILDREAAEKTTGLDAIDLSKPEEYFGLGDSQPQLQPEIYNLNVAISKLFQVIRVIIMQCDNRVSEVTSNILQCLQSIEEDKKSIPDMLQVQKSVETCKDP